jgi:CRP-like cAMP-binding protein
MGDGTTSSSAIVEIAGAGHRIKSSILLQALNQSTSLMHLLLRYTQAIMTQMAVCNRHHLLEQQLCRFLLTNLDRLSSNEITLTQDLIARSIGVRREGITESALKLKADGLIKYCRGHITILNRRGLESRSCECYKVVKDEYERLLPAKIAA